MIRKIKYPIIKLSHLKRLVHLIVDLDLHFYISEKGVDPSIHYALKDLFLAVTARQPFLKPKRINNLKYMAESFNDRAELVSLINEILNDTETI